MATPQNLTAPYWHQRTPLRPPDDGSLPEAAEVVVVGAGITGLLTAFELTRRGHPSVVVLEARAPAAGTTGSSTAKVTALHGTAYSAVARQHGRAGARRYAAANLAGLEQLRRTVAELDAECDWSPNWASTFTTDPRRIGDLEREHDAAREAGLAARLIGPAEHSLPVAAAVALHGQASVDPVRLVGALRHHLHRNGVPVLRARVIAVDGTPPVVHTDRGTVRAAQVVAATLAPVVDPTAVFAKVEPTMSYSVVARLRSPVPDGMHLSIDRPSRSIRPLVPGSDVAVFGGGGHRVGEGDPVASIEELRAWVHETYEVVEELAAWSAHDLVPVDGVPFIGRADHGILVAGGFRKWGFTHAGAASLLLAGEIEGRPPEWAPLFDPARTPTSVVGLAKGNLEVGRHYVADRVLHRGPTCTHLGCRLRHNDAADTWDCPCHGSRFEADGTVRSGPATRDLDLSDPGPGRRRTHPSSAGNAAAPGRPAPG